jgi:vancomycin resistance protein VanW
MGDERRPMTERPAVRRARVAVHQARRLAGWALDPRAYPRPVHARGDAALSVPIGRRSAPVFRADPHADPRLEQGKRANLALAVPAIDGLEITPERPLSIWRALGPPTAARGFQVGMELAEGCVVPAVGGGLCLLSNALFELAVRAGFAILERHGHTREVVPDRRDPWGLDATLFYPYVDLRFAPVDGPVRLGARLEPSERGPVLVVEAWARAPLAATIELASVDDRTATGPDGQAVRENRIVRTRRGPDGRVLGEEVVAVNRKVLTPHVDQGRTCLSCDEDGCASRASYLDLGVGG